MSETAKSNLKKVMYLDDYAFHYERILGPQEFAEAFTRYLHFLYDGQPEKRSAALEHFDEEKLEEIQARHQYTDVDMQDAFEAGR